METSLLQFFQSPDMELGWEQILLKIRPILLTRFQLNSLTMATQVLVLAQGRAGSKLADLWVGLLWLFWQLAIGLR